MLEGILEAWQFLIRDPEVVAGWTLEHLWIVFIACGIAGIHRYYLGKVG